MTHECQIDVRFHAPPADLADCLTSVYRLQLTVAHGERVTDWLQPEWANFRLFSGAVPAAQISGGGNLLDDARMTVTGPSARSLRFELGSTRMWGVGLLPLGWARFVCRPASRYANLLADAEKHPDFQHFAPLAGLLDGEPDDDAEFARVVALLRRLDTPCPESERIGAVHRALMEPGLASVGQFADLAGMSVRALERICRRHFGFAPKLLLRRQRFMRSLAGWMLGGMGRWSEAIDELYTDQAHFNRDFHAFMGMGPSEYAALPHPILSAFMEQRARTWGSPAQTLDRPGGHHARGQQVARAT